MYNIKDIYFTYMFGHDRNLSSEICSKFDKDITKFIATYEAYSLCKVPVIEQLPYETKVKCKKVLAVMVTSTSFIEDAIKKCYKKIYRDIEKEGTFVDISTVLEKEFMDDNLTDRDLDVCAVVDFLCCIKEKKMSQSLIYSAFKIGITDLLKDYSVKKVNFNSLTHDEKIKCKQLLIVNKASRAKEFPLSRDSHIPASDASKQFENIKGVIEKASECISNTASILGIDYQQLKRPSTYYDEDFDNLAAAYVKAYHNGNKENFCSSMVYQTFILLLLRERTSLVARLDKFGKERFDIDLNKLKIKHRKENEELKTKLVEVNKLKHLYEKTAVKESESKEKGLLCEIHDLKKSLRDKDCALRNNDSEIKMLKQKLKDADKAGDCGIQRSNLLNYPTLVSEPVNNIDEDIATDTKLLNEKVYHTNKKIVIVGGCTNVTNKISKTFPDLKIITTATFDKLILKNAEYIVYIWGGVKHTIKFKLVSAGISKEKIIFSEKTYPKCRDLIIGLIEEEGNEQLRSRHIKEEEYTRQYN